MLFNSSGNSRTVNPGTSICTSGGLETMTNGFSTRAGAAWAATVTPPIRHPRTRHRRRFMPDSVRFDLRHQPPSIGGLSNNRWIEYGSVLTDHKLMHSTIGKV